MWFEKGEEEDEEGLHGFLLRLGIFSISSSVISLPQFLQSSSSPPPRPQISQSLNKEEKEEEEDCFKSSLCFRPSISYSSVRGEVRSDELEQEVLEGVQAPTGVPQGSIRVQLGSQEEQLPVLGHRAQRQGFMQLRHAHSVGLIL